MGLIVEPGEYKPDKVLFSKGFNGFLVIFFHSSLPMPYMNIFGSNVGED